MKPTDFEKIEKIIYKDIDDAAVATARSFERMEECLNAAESRIYSRLADVEDKLEAIKQDVMDSIGDLKEDIEKVEAKKE